VEHNRLGTTIDRLLPCALESLSERFGTVERFVHGFGYHNADHGRDVGSAAAELAHELVDNGLVGPETIPLANFAGCMHDQVQGEGHERLSAFIAAEVLREQGVPERHIGTVKTMIRGTEVLRIEDNRIVQVANRDDPRQALLADADLATLGMRKGPFLTLLLNLELQHLNGTIRLPTPTDGNGIEPDRTATERFLDFQVALYDKHRYMLAASRRKFPHQKSNRDEIARLLELYRGDRITYPMMLASANRYAAS
jgi:predicted metal-dependent HD superfamily phosphohydrolase